MSTTIQTQGITMSIDAARLAEETGVDVRADVRAIRTGEHTSESLLAYCHDGADEDRREGWREYVSAVVAAAAVPE